MPIEASEDKKITKPAVELDQWWMVDLHISAPSPSLPVVATAQFRLTDGTICDGGRVTHRVNDLFALAANDPELQTIVTSLLAKVHQLAGDKL